MNCSNPSTYDAAGKRTSRTDRFGTDVYAYKAGYQLDSISGVDGDEDYEFDANGRLTLIKRGGETIDLNHDAGDRLTEVATNGVTTRYQYDGAGNRVGATSGNATRQFLVAPSMGGGLQSTDLIADGNGNLLSNYVYAGGHTPFMRIDANGNPIYYLTDAMGSVIGLADGTGAETGDFRYDSFGNLRGLTGTPALIDPMGGDFRFQGQWLESETGIYHFRARDYDAHTGRFISRDPVDPTAQQPEALNPYQFAYSNPHIYSDPTGMITLGEVNAAKSAQEILQKAQTYVWSQVRQSAVDQAKGVATDVLKSVFKQILPFDSFIQQQPFQYITGGRFAEIIQGAICNVVKDSYAPFKDYLWFEAEVAPNGTPLSNGFGCGQIPNDPDTYFLGNGLRAADDLLSPRPDLIVKRGAPVETDRNPPSYLTLEIKRSVQEALRSRTRQWNAIMNYAQPTSSINLQTRQRGHQYVPVAVYATLFDENSPGQRQRLISKGLQSGVHLGVISLLPGEVTRGRRVGG